MRNARLSPDAPGRAGPTLAGRGKPLASRRSARNENNPPPRKAVPTKRRPSSLKVMEFAHGATSRHSSRSVPSAATIPTGPLMVSVEEIGSSGALSDIDDLKSTTGSPQSIGSQPRRGSLPAGRPLELRRAPRPPRPPIVPRSRSTPRSACPTGLDRATHNVNPPTITMRVRQIRQLTVTSVSSKHSLPTRRLAPATFAGWMQQQTTLPWSPTPLQHKRKESSRKTHNNCR